MNFKLIVVAVIFACAGMVFQKIFDSGLFLFGVLATFLIIFAGQSLHNKWFEEK